MLSVQANSTRYFSALLVIKYFNLVVKPLTYKNIAAHRPKIECGGLEVLQAQSGSRVSLKPLNESPILGLQCVSVHKYLDWTGILDIVAVHVPTASELSVLKGVAAPATLDFSASFSLGITLAVVTNVFPSGLHTHVV